jgi:hypothetical protein
MVSTESRWKLRRKTSGIKNIGMSTGGHALGACFVPRGSTWAITYRCPWYHPFFSLMSTVLSTSASHPNFASILNAAFETYKLERDAVVNGRGNYGRTPLHWAAENGRIEVV